MIHSTKNLHRLNILANSDYTGQVDGILREGRYYPLAINRTITAKRAFDINPMPSRRYKDRVRSIVKYYTRSITAKRAFRGMAGLAVLYPSVVDYIGQAVKGIPVCLPDDSRGYSVNLCR